jgi:hypothetical protein
MDFGSSLLSLPEHGEDISVPAMQSTTNESRIRRSSGAGCCATNARHHRASFADADADASLLQSRYFSIKTTKLLKYCHEFISHNALAFLKNVYLIVYYSNQSINQSIKQSSLENKEQQRKK